MNFFSMSSINPKTALETKDATINVDFIKKKANKSNVFTHSLKTPGEVF